MPICWKIRGSNRNVVFMFPNSIPGCEWMDSTYISRNFSAQLKLIQGTHSRMCVRLQVKINTFEVRFSIRTTQNTNSFRYANHKAHTIEFDYDPKQTRSTLSFSQYTNKPVEIKFKIFRTRSRFTSKSFRLQAPIHTDIAIFIHTLRQYLNTFWLIIWLLA